MVGAGSGTTGADLALRFVRATVAANHQLAQVFFYHDAVEIAVERNAASLWLDAVRGSECDLLVCVAAAERRGLFAGVDQPATGFRVAGLAQWLDASLDADRVVRFGPSR